MKMKREGLYATMGFSTKEELLVGIKTRLKRIKSSYSADEKETEKYKAYLEFLEDFKEHVKNMELPRIADEDWYYSFGMSESCATVTLDKLIFKSSMEVKIEAAYKLYKVEPRLLPSDEYARLHDVTDTTVRQWIRRGKLREASKYGNTWRIPEFAEPRQGRYCNVMMGWKETLTDIYSEYEFLNKYDEAQIQQLSKNEYKVWFANNETGEYAIKTMDCKERERFELMMITNPFVSVFDLPGVDIDMLESNWKNRK